ncbi:MAG: flagellar biosynthetic protein FliO [Planctomycetota bacterium]
MPHLLALLAQAATEAPAEAPVRLGGAAPDLSWLMAVVAVFVVTMAAIAFGFRKLLTGAIKARSSRRDLRVLDVLPLGGKRQLAVVRCYDRTFALGLGERSVDLVAELDTEAVDVDREAAGARKSAFEERLVAARSRLLGVHEISAPKTDAPAASDVPAAPASASSTREFVA